MWINCLHMYSKYIEIIEMYLVVYTKFGHRSRMKLNPIFGRFRLPKKNFSELFKNKCYRRMDFSADGWMLVVVSKWSIDFSKFRIMYNSPIRISIPGFPSISLIFNMVYSSNRSNITREFPHFDRCTSPKWLLQH